MSGKQSFEERLARINASGSGPKQPKASKSAKQKRGRRGKALVTVPISLGLLAGVLFVFDGKLTDMGFDEEQRCQFKQGTMLSDTYRESLGLAPQSDC